MAWQVDFLSSFVSAVAFTLSAFGLSVLTGLAVTLLSARKIEPSAFAQGTRVATVGQLHSPVKHEPAVRFAFRALGYGTALAVTGVGSLAYIVWKITGARNISELNRYFQTSFPETWKLRPTDSATNFKTFDELTRYITTDYPKTPRDS
ncbi:hypothetical protein FGIG_08426 [Fasciola gigantica]|uniref:Transmembrane protein 242 n=1 Tax=Fasciola gigantica TaxID=46835 RepID=A0A504YV49_FASGI|nr:hypothetical protein FGIG_08426 [Fasciola gigantica]